MSASNFLTETYGGIRLEFLKNVDGKELWDRLWGDHLFLNLYDFWCIRQHGYLVDNYQQKNKFLKKIIRRKVKGDVFLPSYKIILRMIANGHYDFNPSPFLKGDWGIFLKKLYSWKHCNKEEFLKIKPWLREPKRYLKILADFQREEVEVEEEVFEFEIDFEQEEKIDYIVN